MLTIESLFSSSFIGQLRAIVHMSTPRDSLSPLERRQPVNGDSDNQKRPAQSTKRPCNRRITQPQQGSLYDIMHEHAGTTLYVVPICWTDQHSQLLGARFRERPAVIKPVPDPAPGVWLEPSRMAQNLTSEMHTLVREDATPARAFCKNRAIKHILSTLFPATLSRPKTGVELNLYFGHRVFRKVVRIPCIWKSPSNVDVSFDSCPTLPSTSFGQVPKTGGREPGMPMLAYINKAQLASIRKHLYGVVRGPENTINEPVRRLQKLRSKMLVPENPDHDPYIVAILIGLAQAHFYRETSRPSSQSSSQGSRKSIRIKPPVFRDVKVQVITHDDGNDSSPNFIIYTATVTATFLKRFMHPDLAPSEDATAGLDITYTPVSFWPILGLKERLSQALGREIAADSIYDNPNYIGLWDPLLELQHPPVRQPVCQPVYQSVRLKRRRGAERHAAAAAGGEGRQPLSQVLNSSFEDEAAAALSSSPEDRPVISPTAKRRRASRSVGPLQVC